MTTRQRFVIAGLQRSGTTVVHTCLRGHPQVSSPSDEVHVAPLFTKGLATFTFGSESYEERQRGMSALFDTLTMITPAADVRAIGLKVAIGDDADATDFGNALREYFPDIAVILIARDDTVAQCASLFRAQRTGQWHAYDGDVGNAGDMLHIPPDQFDAYARQCARLVAQLELLGETHRLCRISYERDIVTGAAWSKLFTFLGIQDLRPTWMRMRKVAPPAVAFVANYAELQARCSTIAPVPADEARLHAQHRAWAAAAGENPNFLLHRAKEHLQRRRVADAQADLLAAFASNRPMTMDFETRGQAAAMLAMLPHPHAETIARAELQLAEALRSDARAEMVCFATRMRLDQLLGTDTLGSTEQARASLLQLLRSGLQPAVTAQALTMLEQCWERSGDLALAEADLQALEPLFADTAALRLRRAWVHLRHGRGADAEREIVAALHADREPWVEGLAFARLREAWAAMPEPQPLLTLAALAPRHADSPYFRLRRAEIHLQREAWREVHRDSLAALLAPDMTPAMVRWAIDLLHQACVGLDDINLAQAASAAIGPRYPGNLDCLAFNALLHFQAGDRQTAIDEMRRVVAIDPHHPVATHHLGLWTDSPAVLSIADIDMQGSPEQARLSLLELLHRSPQPAVTAQALTMLEQCWERSGDLALAEADLQALEPLFADTAALRLRRAWVHLRHGRGVEAEREIVAALHADREPWIEGLAFARLQDAWTAMPQPQPLPTLMALAPRYADSPYFRLRRAWIQSQANAWREVYDDSLAALLGRDMTPGMVGWAIDMLHQACLGLDDMALAEVASKAIEPRYPGNLDCLAFAALVRYHSGDQQTAITDMRRVLAAAPQHPLATRHLALWAAVSPSP